MEILIQQSNRVVDLFSALRRHALLDSTMVPDLTNPNVTAEMVLQTLQLREQEISAFKNRIAQLKDATTFLEDIPNGNDDI